MHNDDTSRNSMEKQMNHLHQYIQHLHNYINYKNVYEYYIQGITVDKVKGTLQLGQLTEREVKDDDGIHRFFIGEIKIKEVEDSGIVGLGVTEKGGVKQKEEEEFVSPDEAPPLRYKKFIMR